MLAGEFGRRGLDVVTIRPKTFIGPERLGVFEILFDWIRDGRRIPILGDGGNLYQLLAVEDLVDAVVRIVRRSGRRRGAERRRRLVRDRAGRPAGADRPRRLGLEALAGPGRASPSSRCGALERARLSPLAEWHYKTAHKDSFVSIEKARALLGWEPRLSNAETLCATYDWYLAHLAEMRGAGTTHRVPWNQQALGVLKRIV